MSMNEQNFQFSLNFVLVVWDLNKICNGLDYHIKQGYNMYIAIHLATRRIILL